MIWFVAVWVIWSSGNGMMFRGVKVNIGDTTEQVKLKSWWWVTTRRPQFQYPVSNWFMNPYGCLGLVKGTSIDFG